jgi:hypothetical protein
MEHPECEAREARPATRWASYTESDWSPTSGQREEPPVLLNGGLFLLGEDVWGLRQIGGYASADWRA